MNESEQKSYDELSLYTLTHENPAFIHQHIVDAYAAQRADAHSKPIQVAFALMGLYLYLEKGYTGKEVQRAHMKIAKDKKIWPIFPLPEDRGDVTVMDVLASAPGPARDAMIRAWCESVWGAWSHVHGAVEKWLSTEKFSPTSK